MPIFNQFIFLKRNIIPIGIKKMKIGIKSHAKYFGKFSKLVKIDSENPLGGVTQFGLISVGGSFITLKVSEILKNTPSVP